MLKTSVLRPILLTSGPSTIGPNICAGLDGTASLSFRPVAPCLVACFLRHWILPGGRVVVWSLLQLVEKKLDELTDPTTEEGYYAVGEQMGLRPLGTMPDNERGAQDCSKPASLRAGCSQSEARITTCVQHCALRGSRRSGQTRALWRSVSGSGISGTSHRTMNVPSAGGLLWRRPIRHRRRD